MVFWNYGVVVSTIIPKHHNTIKPIKVNPTATVNHSFQNIIDKNADAICAGYFVSEELYVILEGPRLSNRGHANISKGWRDFVNSPISLLAVDWTEGPYEEVTDDMAWIGGIIVLKIEVKGKVFEQTFRATFVLTRQDDSWKIKHEHVSAAHADPYGIGDWLKK